METVGRDSSETGSVTKKKGKTTTCIGGSLTSDYRDKEGSVAVSLRTTGIKRDRWQSHFGLQG